ncbi:unnamed protein product [Mucor circinelloides]|uniref:RTA1 like protein n=1 Tax=Mucor circinelloides f. circinelloides (strain 1006PhL) TaxID=1220926 RepID=S2JU37_MUCC1|nr:hypothetical protein HMPREF1544_09946 [Mucor circinelloides 1006PhL]
MNTFMSGNGSQALRFFKYVPSLAPAAVSIALYSLVAIYLTIRIFMSKSPRFLYILPFTAIVIVVGFAFRILCHFYTDLDRFLAMTLLLLLAPNALALVNYKAVGEIIRLSNVKTKYFFLRPKFVTWFFFSSDFLAFFLQGAGGGLQSNYKYKDIAVAITMVGLATQLFFFACFAGITFYVQRSPKYQYYVEGQPDPKKKLIWCLYVTIGLLYVRSIYRFAEYATGYGGPIAVLEWAFYVFDTIAIFLSFLVYCIFFIGNYLPKYNAPPQSPDEIGSSSSQTMKGDVESGEKL